MDRRGFLRGLMASAATLAVGVGAAVGAGDLAAVREVVPEAQWIEIKETWTMLGPDGPFEIRVHMLGCVVDDRTQGELTSADNAEAKR